MGIFLARSVDILSTRHGNPDPTTLPVYGGLTMKGIGVRAAGVWIIHTGS